MRIPIVDQKDKIVEYKNRQDIKSEDIYRVSSLWVTNSKGEILLAQRHLNKTHDPGKWGPAVAGTVEEGETYESNIVKEAEEELGIVGIKFKDEGRTRRYGKHNFFVQKFSACLDNDISGFKVNKNEIEQIKWFSADELKEELGQDPAKFIPSIIDDLKKLPFLAGK